MMRSVCVNCKQAAGTIACSRCEKTTAYCSEECRATHWATHHYRECKSIGTDSLITSPHDDDDDEDVDMDAAIATSDVESQVIEEIPSGVSLQFCKGTVDVCAERVKPTDTVLQGNGTPGMSIDEFIDRILDRDQVLLRRFKEALRYVYGETWKLYMRLLQFLEREIGKIKERFFNARGKRWEDPDLKGEHGLSDEEMEGFSRAETRVVDLLLNIRDARSYFDEYGDNVDLPDVSTISEERSDISSHMRRQVAVEEHDDDDDVPGTPGKDIFIALLDENSSSRIGARTRSTFSRKPESESESDGRERRRQPPRRGSQRAKKANEFDGRAQELLLDLSNSSAKQNVQWTFLSDFTAALRTDKTTLEGRSDYIRTWVIRKGNSAEWGFQKLTYPKRDLERFIGELFREGFSVREKRSPESTLPGVAFEDDDEDEDDDDGASATTRTLTQKKELLKRQLRKKSTIDQKAELANRVFNIIDTLETINTMIGLVNIKQRIVKLVVRFITRPQRIFGDIEEGVSPQHLGVMYLGPPGTGKTTLARNVANLFRALGMVPTKYSETESIRVLNSGDFIAAFEGQTPLKTRNLVLSLLGDSFLFDEIYELGRSVRTDGGGGGGGSGIESLNTLVQLFDQFKGLVAPQGAGYKNLIESQIYRANRGFKRRFPNQWTIYTYKVDELIAYFRLLVRKRSSAITFLNTNDSKADSEPVAENTLVRSRVQKYAEEFIGQAREAGYFVDSNSAGVETFVTEIADAVDVRNLRHPNPITAEGRHTVILEDILAGIEEFVVSSGKPRTLQEVAAFDQRDSSLVFFYST